MMRVSNRKAILRLTWKSFKANRSRNIFAALAMALTCVLFTSLFTAAVGVNNSFEQQTMREVGGFAHGNFKYLNKEQVKELSHHPLIKEYGANLLLSGLFEGTFAKHTAEIRYFDENSARMFFVQPTTGTLPKDKYDFAADTAVLKQLGIEPKLGETVSITYPLEDKKVTDTFTLCGYWTADPLIPASEIALSKEYVEEKLVGYTPQYEGDTTGTWDLEYMFHNSRHIEDNLRTIAEDSGYQIDDSTKENYLGYGVNWAYTSAQMEHDYTLPLTVAGIGIIILFTGYLIIYNIFLISVANDIRYYGLLKTIGTTGRQIKRIIRWQAMLLSVLGIPAGLVLGYFFGCRITPLIMSTMSTTATYQTSDPVIFAGAAVFTIITVLISIRKPGRVASKVSPVEAVRYTEGAANSKKAAKATRHGARIHRMAISNLLRNKRKTILVIISLSLSVSLLNSVYVFTSGFSLDKYVSQFMISDYTIASSNYFNVMKGLRESSDSVPEDYISEVMKQSGITGAGRIYYDLNLAVTDFTQQMIDVIFAGVPESELNNYFCHIHGENAKDGTVQLYGMDDFMLKKLEVVEGTLDLDKLKTGKYILLVVSADDYGNPFAETEFYHPGDKVELDYVDELENSENTKIKHHSKTYEVLALVEDNISWDVRYYSTFAMILPSAGFIEDTGTDTIMSYQFDVDDKDEAAMEQFLKNYTQKVNPDMSYVSKETHRKEFEQFKNTFIIIGNSLSLVIAVIGILNYINVILTGIITRKREFSILKSIGMTGKQLISLLMYEGLIYAGLTLIVAAVCSTVLNLTLVKSMGEGFWFFQAKFSLLPVLIVVPLLLLFGILIPYAAYKITNRDSIVDQLRAFE